MSLSSFARIAVVLVALGVGACGGGPVVSSSPPAPAPSLSPVSNSPGSSSIPTYPDGIPRVVDGLPVLRPSAAAAYAEAATDATPFLVGGWTVGAPGISCPTAFSRPALAPSCLTQMYWLGEAPGLQGLWGRLFNLAGLALPQTGAVVLRVHTHDPLASACSAEFRRQCDTAMVMDALVWANETATASPTPVPASPYHLALGGTDHLIRSASDCTFIPSAWLRDFCALALRADWRAIATDGDPLGRSETWYAAMARAQMDGDLSICDDVRMRTWLTLASKGGAPSPSASLPPVVGPIATCRTILSNPPRPGSISVDDSSSGTKKPVSLTVTYQPPTIPLLPQPVFDPGVVCTDEYGFSMSATTCSLILGAVLASTDLDSSSITIVGVRPHLLPCTAPLPCPGEPQGATGLGSALIGYRDRRTVYVNAFSTGGAAVLVAVVPQPSSRTGGS